MNIIFSEYHHIMMVGPSGHGNVPWFRSLSPTEHPLPSCLAQRKNALNIGNGRYRPALFPSNGINHSQLEQYLDGDLK